MEANRARERKPDITAEWILVRIFFFFFHEGREEKERDLRLFPSFFLSLFFGWFDLLREAGERREARGES